MFLLTEYIVLLTDFIALCLICLYLYYRIIGNTWLITLLYSSQLWIQVNCFNWTHGWCGEYWSVNIHGLSTMALQMLRINAFQGSFIYFYKIQFNHYFPGKELFLLKCFYIGTVDKLSSLGPRLITKSLSLRCL